MLCTWLLKDGGEGGCEGWHSATRSETPCPHRPPETQSPNAARPRTKKSPFLLATKGAWAAHIMRQAPLSDCFRSQGMGRPSPG